MTHFYGRKEEVKTLRYRLKDKGAKLLILRGRPGIGKARLAKEIAKKGRSLFFSARIPFDDNAPIKTAKQVFAKQLQQHLNLEQITDTEWQPLLGLLAQLVRKGRLTLILDQISQIGLKDSSFLEAFKSIWKQISKNPKLSLILCDSSSEWIEKTLLTDQDFSTQISCNLLLDELSLPDCKQFLSHSPKHLETYELFKVLSVTGGVPKYLEELNLHLVVDEAIGQLAFQKNAPLHNEFEKLFPSSFSKKKDKYHLILKALAKEDLDINGVCLQLGIKKGGLITDYLSDLIACGYVARDFTWAIKSATRSKLSVYRLKDNFLRFYFRYIEPNQVKISKAGQIKVPSWYAIMQDQLKNLILTNQELLFRLLQLPSQEVVHTGPYFQRDTFDHPSCRIDLMIQSRYKTLYVCEIEFSKDKIGKSIIDEMKEKIRRLCPPRHFSVRPVLIHVNGVAEAVKESGFFSNIIPLSHFFLSRAAPPQLFSL